MALRFLPVAAVLVAVALPFSGGCGNTEPLPLPNLGGMEGPVREKIRRCRKAVVDSPSAATWDHYARTLDAHGLFPEAEQAYLAAAEATSGKAAFEHLPRAGNAVYDLAPKRAVEHLTRALALRDDHMATHLYLATLLEKLGKSAEARKRYAVVAARWSSSHALLGLGRLALEAGDANTALAHLQRAQKLSPEHRQVYEAMARAYARLGQHDAGRAAAKKAGDLSKMHVFPDELMAKILAEDVQAVTRFHRGVDLGNAKRWEEAIVEFRAGLVGQPNHLPARLYLSQLLFATGKPDESLTHLNFVLGKNERHKDALELRANIFLQKNKRAEAERDLRALLRVDPGNAWARSQLRK